MLPYFTARFSRTAVLLCVLFSWISGSPSQIYGQTLGPVPDLAVEFAPKFSYGLDDEAFFNQIFYSKISSASQVVPEYTSTGIVHTIFMSAGTRTKNFENYDFRWRAGLLDMDITRLPFSFGATLLDINNADRLETDIRWANFRVGPSLYYGTPSNYFTLRVVGAAGLTTVKLGDFTYNGLSTGEGLALRKRSYEVGYKGELFVFFADRIAISGSYSHRRMMGGIEPKFFMIEGVLGVRVNQFVTIQGSYTLEASKSGSSSLDKSFIGFGMGLLL